MLDCQYDDLSDDECFGLLEIYRSVLLSKAAIKTGKIRTTDNASESQKDIYHLALLTLNLGAINRQPLIGGTKKFPSWIRRDPSCVVPSSPDLQEWRSYCRIV